MIITVDIFVYQDDIAWFRIFSICHIVG